ncbi:hypothetical protein [Gordonia sp. (in: high G+C Gram-positive bacteria)]|uniref:hypothetical protein n=1 Tax=Gordonia sp. (in: high G+C Gram-positive bacteria) TaxID=84139 RepID=UPI003F9E29DA
MNTRTLRLLPVAGLAAVAVLGATGAPAQAAESASLSIDGDLEIMPGVHLLNIDAEGTRTDAGKTSGTYTATLMNGMSKVPFQIKGPVTCIDTRGDAAALVYPISATAPNLVPDPLKDMLAVKISVRKGAADRVGVMGPAPTSSFRGCAPETTPFRFDGDIEIA